MEINSSPKYGDSKAVRLLTGFSRQHINKLENNPKSGFPKGIRIGKNVRYDLIEIDQWMQAHKAGNEGWLQKIIDAKEENADEHAVKKLPKPQPYKKAMKPSLAQIHATNRKVLATRLDSGQIIVRSDRKTSEGARAEAFRIVRIAPKPPRCLGLRPIRFEHRPKKTYPPGGLIPIDTALATEPLTGSQATSDVAPLNSALEYATLLEAIKAAYEGGMTVDQLCQQFRIGKTRASKLLRNSGAHVRKPGRKGDSPSSKHTALSI